MFSFGTKLKEKLVTSFVPVTVFKSGLNLNFWLKSIKFSLNVPVLIVSVLGNTCLVAPISISTGVVLILSA